ncbi:helix-turn-helix domain-containing protein [Salinibacillus xinjiangensis]|nr:helix-turn-helix transcriptional regulator [Salinibacillus xinjiangensis]
MYQGKLIKYYRTRKGMTQKDLASGICSVSYLSKIENETIEPSSDVLELLSERLNISLDSQEESVETRQRILDWYTFIKDKDFEKASEEYDYLKDVCLASGSQEIKNLFFIFEFGYLNVFQSNNKKLTFHYQQLEDMMDLFNNESLYYFYKFKSMYQYNKNDLLGALKSLQNAEEIYPNLDQYDLSLYYNLSVFYRRTYQLYKSLIYAEKSLQDAQNAIDYEMITNSQILISVNHIGVGEYQLAEKDLLKLKKQKKYLKPHTIATIFHNLGYIYYQWNHLEKAIEHLMIAVDNYKKNEDKVDSIYLLCLVYYTKKDISQLRKSLSSGQSLSEAINSQKFVFKFYILENKLNKTTLDEGFIMKMEKEIIPFFTNSGEHNEIMRHLKLLGDIYYEKRQYKKASEYYKQIHHFYTNTFRLEDY